MWRPDPPTKVAHLDVDVTGRGDRDAVVWDAGSAQHVYGPGAGSETVFPPGYTVDTTGDIFDVTVTVVWGIDATGEPYYNAAGVTAGHEAVLVFNNTTGEFSLRPIEV